MPTEAQFAPPDDDPLRKATPAVDDVEARRAKAAIEGRLFSGPPKRVKVGRYRVLGRIGSGGMGVVYKAHDPDLARDVAVKLMNADAVADADTERARGRLVREARAMARLAHPNVIHVYDVGMVEDGVFIAMELVEGQSLSAWIRSEKRPWQEILQHYLEAGRGLAAAHEAGVIHRDFKPENVLVGSDGRVRVGDFGLAGGPGSETGRHSPSVTDSSEDPMSSGSVGEALTRTGALLGTPKYMAPEQESGLGATARSDQFSFCVALHEALYGQAPFAGESVIEYRRNVRNGNVRVGSAPPKLPPWVGDVLRRGLSPDPVDRHGTVAGLLDRLAEALVDPATVLAATSRRRRRLGLFVAIGIAVVGVAGVVGAQFGETARPAKVVAVNADPQPVPAPAPEIPAPEPLPTKTPAIVTKTEEPPAPEPTKSDKASHKDAKQQSKSRRRSGVACYFRADRPNFIKSDKGKLRSLSHEQTCYHRCSRASAGEASKLEASEKIKCRVKFRCEIDRSGKACAT